MKRIITLTILMLPAVNICLAQTPGFGSFGTQNDTVTALYKSGTNLYVGARTTNAMDRAKMYNGTSLSTIGYNPQPFTPSIWMTGKEICAIGRSTTGIIAFFDKSSTNSYTGAFEYTESTGTWGANGTNFYNSFVTAVSDHNLVGAGSMVGGSYSTSNRIDGTQHLPVAGKCSVYGATSSTFFDRVTQPWGSTTFYPNDFTFHNSTMYYCTDPSTSNNGIWYVAANVWTTANIPTGFLNVHEVQSFAGDLYLVVRNAANTSDTLYVWDGTTLAGTGISGQINDLEVHASGPQRLYVAGDKLRSLELDQVTWTTLIPSFANGGQITVMESYGTKLALGGYFSEINGNTSLSKLAFLEYGNPPVSGISTTITSLCAGSSTTLTSSSTGTINTYSWDIQGGTPSISSAQNPGTVLFNTTGVYIVSLTVTNNFGSSTDTETITVNSLPSVGAGSDQTVCAGSSITLSGSGANSYSWNNGVTNDLPFNPGFTNTYTVWGTDANGCINTDQVMVTVNSLPNVNAGSDQTVCEGTSVTLSASGASTYSWDNGVSNGVSFTPIGTVTYTVTGTNVNGCMNTDQVIVSINSNPTPVITQVGLDLTSNYATGNQWFVDANPIAGSQTITPSINGVYTITVTDNNGCIGTSDPFIVNDVGLSEEEIAQYITITNGQMSISINWSLYDVTGRLLASGNPGNVPMPSGVFILVTEKFIKKYLNNSGE